MSKRRERTLQELCGATDSLSQTQACCPNIKRKLWMQRPVDEADCDLLTHMVTSEISKAFSSCSYTSQKVDSTGRSRTCNVCSSPGSSCFHVDKFLMKSNDESAGEICAENVEIGQSSVLSVVVDMKSTSDSLSEKAVGKASSRISNASASDDCIVHSKSEGRGTPEVHDDCLSGVSGTEHANKKSDIEGESSDKVLPSSSPTGSQIPYPKSTDDATDLLKGQHTSSQASSGEYLSHDGNPRVVKDDKPCDIKDELLESSSNVVCGDLPATALISTIKNDDMEVEIETDDSDMVEDVKVCDICGDAGREDLLAICCRCSDGAEHTYCMREMLAKVPEGEWLCEECKSVERVGHGRQEMIGRMDENEKNNSSGQASSEYVNSSDAGRRNKGSTRTPCKRHRDDDDTEVSSLGKKPALESLVGSPKISNTSKTAALTRDTSLKNLDKGRHSSSDTVPVNDITESASSASDHRAHNIRGIFSKSNSFSSLSSKPKVRLVDQVVIQRQKSAKEHGSFHLKEGAVRSIGKSMSFKSTNSSRSESKTKMISPKPSHAQEIKNTKQRNPFERQSSFRADHSSMVGTSMSSTPRAGKRPASRGEPSSLSTIANHHEVKPVQSDGKSATLSKSSSLAARRATDLSSSLGESKRRPVYGNGAPGASSVNGVNNIDQKSIHASVKDDSSCSVVSEKPPFNANEGLPDALARPRDLTNSGERMREYPGSRFGPPSAKSSRDETDNLKAAIEAAVLRKPGVYRRHRALGQPEVSSVSSVGLELAPHQSHIPSFARKNKFSTDAELPERPTVSRNSNADSLKQENLNNVKQNQSLIPLDGLSSGGHDGCRFGPSSRDLCSDIPAATPFFLKSLAIPEHEYIWQGSFDIYRNGKTLDSWNGVQAHLSSCASPKVIDAVNKFKNKIVLYEVPRLSTWPVQFQEHGVKEDNIALFFFAKDLESYDNIYKVLLDNMMKNDLALKGDFNGVELLIFPSNQLPENSRRWNMLFFLWGVFRGKKESCLQHMPEPLDQFCAPQDIPPPIMSLPENRCSLRPIAEDLHMTEDAAPVLEVSASEELQRLLSSKVNEDCGTKLLSSSHLDHRPDSSFLPVVRSDSAKQCQEMRGSSQERGISSSCSPPLAMRSSSFSGREQMLVQSDTPVDRPQSSHNSSKSVTGTLAEGTGERTIFYETRNQNQVKLIMDAGDLSTDKETPLEDEPITRDLNVPFSDKECMDPEPTLHAGTSQVTLGNDDTYNGTSGAFEKVSKMNFAGFYTRLDKISSSADGFVSQTNHMPSGSYAVQNRHQEPYVETLISGCIENPERHFFPVESQPLAHGLPWKMHMVEQDRLNDRVPNLELALGGAETKPPTPMGIRPFLVSEADQKLNEHHILEGAGKKMEDDVSATLSLSLAFPFPEKELSTRPAPKTEQLVSERDRAGTSMLLFGNLRDN